jgi:hypothetical protein
MANATLGNVVDFTLTGRADDGDPATAPAPGSYTSTKANPGPNRATDGRSQAESDHALFDRLGGLVFAVPGAPGMAASALSSSHVVTDFSITVQGAYTFTLSLVAQGITTSGQGALEITQRANILDGQGAVILSNSANPALGIRPDTVLIDAPTDYKGHRTNENVSSTSTVPPNGVTLPPGNYRLELDLILTASAPKSDGPISIAEVRRATFSIKLDP